MKLPLQLLSNRVRRDMRDARARMRMPVESAAAMAARQLRDITTVWADAVRDVPYYSSLVASGRAPREVRSWDEFHAVPVLSRQALQDEPSQFLRRSGPPEGYTNTAGSTGTPLTLGMNQFERDLMRIVKLAEWQAFGYRGTSRLFLIWGHQHLLGTGRTGQLNHVRRIIADRFLGYQRVNAYRLNRDTSREIAEQLIRFRPVGLIGYSAALDLFARHTREYRKQFRALNLGFVLVTTEAPPREDSVATLQDLFGCPVVEEYGGGDFGQVAFKRGSAPFHVYADLNYLECEAEDTAEPGVCPALVTALYSRYTPLIRYRIGDGLVAPRMLPHGHVGAFERVAGRLTDSVALDEGDAIHSLSIFHCVHQEPDIYNVQMRLTDSGIDILLVTAAGADRAAIESRVRPRLSQVHPRLAGVRFVYVEDVETSRAGKRRWCVDLRTRKPSCAA
jgi:phenylacetate-coenzyme A ligase PaaK-like adenylate-forming protein